MKSKTKAISIKRTPEGGEANEGEGIWGAGKSGGLWVEGKEGV